MSDNEIGRPARELSDEELAEQGTQAHATRNWVFLHGSAEQFARHTSRMLELEREYLRRFPKRTWQGSGGAAGDAQATAVAWRSTIETVISQLQDLVAAPAAADASAAPNAASPEQAFLRRLADAGGRLHKLEAHQAARECGLDPTRLASLYKGNPQLVTTEGQDRALTPAGQSRLDAEQP